MPSTVELRSWRTSEVQVISHMRIADLFGRAFPFLAHSNTLLSLPVLHLPVSLSFTHLHPSCPFLSFIFLSPYPSPIRTLPVLSCPSSSCLPILHPSAPFVSLPVLHLPASLSFTHPHPSCPFLSFIFLSPILHPSATASLSS